MTDIVTPSTRSRMMSGIRGKDTHPEVALRHAIHARGLRYRKNVRGMAGTPDLLFPGKHAALFVHGCYWHRHPGCTKAATPASNAQFWKEKFRQNVARDKANISQLRDDGWRVGVVWECQIGRTPSSDLVDDLVSFLESDSPTFGLDF